MKSRMSSGWMKKQCKNLCTECLDRINRKHAEEYERAIRAGFVCGMAVTLKSQQLYKHYGKKRLQGIAEDIKSLVAIKPYGKEIDFQYIVDEMKNKYGIDLEKIELVVDVKPSSEKEKV